MDKVNLKAKIFCEIGKIFCDLTLQYNAELERVPLTGAPFYFNGRDLMYLTLHLEKVFGLAFTEEQMVTRKLITIDAIADSILEVGSNR